MIRIASFAGLGATLRFYLSAVWVTHAAGERNLLMPGLEMRWLGAKTPSYLGEARIAVVRVDPIPGGTSRLLRNRLVAQQSPPSERGLARFFRQLLSSYLPTTE